MLYACVKARNANVQELFEYFSSHFVRQAGLDKERRDVLYLGCKNLEKGNFS